MKILWLDVETTGLDEVRNDIITLSAIIEIDGIVQRSINLKIQPHSWDNINDEALKINGITREQMKTFDTPEVAHEKLIAFFERYVDRFDSTDKFQPAGYNITFDMLMLASFFTKCGDKYFGSWIDYHKFDVATLVQFLYLLNVLVLENYKLVTVAKELEMKLEAHTAKSDIKITRDIAYKLINTFKLICKELLGKGWEDKVRHILLAGNQNSCLEGIMGLNEK